MFYIIRLRAIKTIRAFNNFSLTKYKVGLRIKKIELVIKVESWRDLIMLKEEKAAKLQAKLK